jgi:hypothetical protein
MRIMSFVFSIRYVFSIPGGSPNPSLSARKILLDSMSYQLGVSPVHDFGRYYGQGVIVLSIYRRHSSWIIVIKCQLDGCEWFYGLFLFRRHFTTEKSCGLHVLLIQP